VLGVLLFLPAWSLRYWQGWIFWLEFSALTTLVTVHFLNKDPALIERRLKAGRGAEKEKVQRTIQSCTSLNFIVLIVYPGIEYRLGWSQLPPYWTAIGDVLVALGLTIIFLVFREISYTSGVSKLTKNNVSYPAVLMA
jgi:protein-S-isoprenylcysteine O-methyltransferase Ste14